CWKHSRQYTGRPCVGLNGTVVSFPHCEHPVLVSTRCPLPEPAVVPAERLALQALHRLGSFLKPLSAKNICSPAVKTNSAPHSAHFSTLSWYSIRCSQTLLGQDRQRRSLPRTRAGQGGPENFSGAARLRANAKLLGWTPM